MKLGDGGRSLEEEGIEKERVEEKKKRSGAGKDAPLEEGQENTYSPSKVAFYPA